MSKPIMVAVVDCATAHFPRGIKTGRVAFGYVQVGIDRKAYNKVSHGDRISSPHSPVQGYWEEWTEFQADLEIIGSGYKGQMLLHDPATDIYFEMFPTDIHDMLKKATVSGGVVSGTFRPVRRSGCIGIEFVA